MPREELRALVTDLDARGIQVQHARHWRPCRASGSRTPWKRRGAADGPSDNRHHICHLQLAHPDDLPNASGELGVLANFQALWALPDADVADINLPAVGEARVQRTHPIGSIAAAGGTIVGGSDWSVHVHEPAGCHRGGTDPSAGSGRAGGKVF
ncbi:MAG: hypothetical protein U5R48_09055 [Gammaproteobacteria bacterium]|nr:hypothetical protein [Gammaproteobacteria bacterium]